MTRVSGIARYAGLLLTWCIGASGISTAGATQAGGQADGLDAGALHEAVVAERMRVAAPQFQRGDFMLRPTAEQPTLSPDGRQLAYLREHDGKRSLWLLSTSDPVRSRVLLSQTTATGLSWSHDGRWLLLESPRQLFAVAVAGQAGSGIVTPLGGRERRAFVMVDPVRPAEVIVLERPPFTGMGAHGPWRLLRIDMHGRRILLHEDTRQIAGFAFDRGGRLAWLQRVEGDALVVYRIDPKRRLHEILRCRQFHRCDLLPVANSEDDLLMRTDLGGDLKRLVRVDADGSLHDLHVDPRGEADLDALTLDPRDARPLVAGYRSTIVGNHGLDDETTHALGVIAARVPQRNLDIVVGRGVDTRWLVGERASTVQQTRWHLYDPRKQSLVDVLDLPPETDRGGKPAQWLPQTAMARKVPFSWHASDGMRLYGFVWLPPGIDVAKAPLVTLVHGGPWNAVTPDEFGAGYSQFLANRGYVVFEPDFRSSTGLGRDYFLAAHGDFGNGRVQRDIVEGTRYLLSQGIGDGDRVGIAGASFGGYSTLLGVTFQPELFKVGVAIVPPADFAWDLRWISRSPEALALSRYVPFKDWLRMLSLDLDDPAIMSRLHAQSPLANAARMRRPLLLVAGGTDHRVAIRGVIEYAAKLKLLGRDASLLVDSTAGHSNDDPLAREANLYLLALMLHRHLGGAAPMPLDRQLRDYIRRNLRMAGPDLAPLATTARD